MAIANIFLARWYSAQGWETGDGAGRPRVGAAIPGGWPDRRRAGPMPAACPAGLAYEQHHDISAVIAELGEQLITGTRGLRFGSRTLTSTRRRNIRAPHCHGSIIHKALAHLITERHQRSHPGLLQKSTRTTFSDTSPRVSEFMHRIDNHGGDVCEPRRRHAETGC
jgi:hypothetical protein